MAFLRILLILLVFNWSFAQEDDLTLSFYGTEHFLIEGTQVDASRKESPYDRLPASHKEKVREAVWNLSKNSAGISIRFHTNSTRIAARWTLLNDNSMNHMADSGIKGVDLYAKNDNGHWQYVNTGRPTDKANESVLVKNMNGKEREYKIYLPLYDGVTQLEVGIDENSTIRKAEQNSKKPLVFYGTSITQGGCASRTGMAHTNIIARKLKRDCINFGFSGNGKMEPPITEVISEIDAKIFIIECLPNMTPEEVTERTVPLVNYLRSKKPDTPILLVENFFYEGAFLDHTKRLKTIEKNVALKAEFDKLVAQNTGSIFYIATENAFGQDHEGTVDGVHFTDLGFLNYAAFLIAEFDRLKLID
ncbi:SGNH/GDSL hydrolase family protein [uncultured Kriegella sp.]|uniref:SGNH/GDSL hydrolase family protein n=1 Tax=uncultured Kriegella sp. TaxID=1798910 RepID=UPI0030DAFB42|tara:strand:- start:14345 stop:15430 length:1086 start_codon:yes stop_codon:yes gene_type:complete